MLGAAVEFLSWREIKSRYGDNGIQVPAPSFGFDYPVITDDTQMAIATAVGILIPNNSVSQMLGNIWQAYLDWYQTQSDPDESRAPGLTCTGSIRGGVMGSTVKPLNDSSGCGGIMRVHPVGLKLHTNPTLAFEVGMETAALTHGSPNAYVPSGLMAMAIAHQLNGKTIQESWQATWQYLQMRMIPEYSEVMHRMKQSVTACIPDGADLGEVIDSQVGLSDNGQGGGWYGHDALAIALFAVSRFWNNPIRAIQVAVNHTGDSDSTGSIAGAILGAHYGAEFLLQELKTHGVEIERHSELEDLADQLVARGS